MPKRFFILLLLGLFALVISVSAQIGPVIPGTSGIRFAVIGDYGDSSLRAADVARLVDSLEPQFIITTGDNNYGAGLASTIDSNIGQFYSNYISPYIGRYPTVLNVENRFFPSLGNHDWQSGSIQPYLDYFTLPGNERYYEFAWGDTIRLFALDSDPHEPDGTDRYSVQAQWLRERLAATTEPWRVVYMHHPPYASDEAFGTEALRWPFQEWGASVVFSGHAHNYERLEVRGFPYFVNGLGGARAYDFGDEVSPSSQFRFNAANGAMLVEVTEETMTINFHGIYGRPVASKAQIASTPNRWLSFDVSSVVRSDGIYTFVVDSAYSGLVGFNALEGGEFSPRMGILLEGNPDPIRVIASEDATVDLVQPDMLLGNETTLLLGRGAHTHQRIYLRFDVTGIGDATVQSVSLNLYLTNHFAAEAGGIAVYHADSPLRDTGAVWTDEAIHWNNAPSLIIDPSPIDTLVLQR